MSYKLNCKWLYRTLIGRNSEKEATTMGGCPEDCSLYETK
jgi:hypothetical protein